MRGNNTLILSYESVCEAIEEYLARHIATRAGDPVVEKVARLAQPVLQGGNEKVQLEVTFALQGEEEEEKC